MKKVIMMLLLCLVCENAYGSMSYYDMFGTRCFCCDPSIDDCNNNTYWTTNVSEECTETKPGKCFYPTGFRDMYNPHDYRIMQRRSTNWPNIPDDEVIGFGEDHNCAYTETPPHNPCLSGDHKVFLPPGTKRFAINYSGTGMGELGHALTYGRFNGSIDTSGLPLGINEAYDKAEEVKLTDVELANKMLGKGYSLDELTKATQWTVSGGNNYVNGIYNGNTFTEELKTGGWLYIQESGAILLGPYYSFYVTYGTYKKWYDTAIWDEKGDPTGQVKYFKPTVDPVQCDVGKDEKTAKLTVKNTGSDTGMKWTAKITEGSDWLEFVENSASGTDTGEIKIRYKSLPTEITTRTGKVQVTALGNDPIEALIVQGDYEDKPILTILPLVRNVKSKQGITTFNVLNSGSGSNDMDWKVTVDTGKDWITYMGPSEVDNAALVFAYKSNTGTARVGSIIIKSSKYDTIAGKTVTIKQEGK